MTDRIEDKLQEIYDENQPDPVFADQLEQELRRIHSSITPTKSVQSPGVKLIRQLTTIAALFVIVLGLFAALPSLRSFAQDLLAQLFSTTNKNQITITYNDLGTGQEFLTLDALQEDVPYRVIAPSVRHSESVEATYFYYPDRHVAIQHYSNVPTQTDKTSRFNIWISHQPIANAQSDGLFALGFDLTLPDDVETRSVQIEDTQAELVQGMWVETGELDADGNMLYRWSENFWQVSLRWQDSEYIYEVIVMPQSMRRLEELEQVAIDVARSMISD